MALFSFGKKDKNPPEAAAPVAKAPPTPPKIQNPPTNVAIPAVRPPQPSGLIPTSGSMPAGAATTQPMVMPRGGPAGAGLKPARPGVAQSSRSTQRIVLPAGMPGGKSATPTKSLATAPTGRINLPMGMILRCLPAEVLAADLAEFEASGAAATEIGLPMNSILTQLPSGKIELPLADLIPHFPAGYLQPTESIASYLPNLINLPLMDVVMRIPPDLLALRADQKDVDAAVINMADPFTEEILREQAEAARRQAAAQANIIDESQVPQAEEFVPSATKTPQPTAAPASRPPSIQLPTTRPAAPPSAPPISTSGPGGARATGPVLPPSPSASARTISASGVLAAPTRATAAIPSRPPVPSPTSAPPVPPVARQTSTLPSVTSVARQTTSVPPSARQTSSLPMPSRPPATPVTPAHVTPPVPATPPPSAPIEPAAAQAPAPAPVVPDAGADELQRLAALAMAQMEEGNEPEAKAPEPVEEAKETVAVPAPPAPEPEPAPVPVAAVTPPPTPVVPTPMSVPPKPVEAPAPVAVAPTPVPTAPAAPLPVAPAPEPKPEPKPEPQQASAGMAFNLNTCTAEELTLNIPGCFPELAESIVAHRTKIGSFKRIEDLLDVPGITKDAYTSLTGEAPPDNRIPLSLNELLGFPSDQHLSLKDVTDRIACWPDVTGCLLGQNDGLSLVGTAPEGLQKEAIVAFAPRMFEALNKSFAEITGRETDELSIPMPGNSFYIFRNKHLYLIIINRYPQMPERHMKVARFVLSALSIRRD